MINYSIPELVNEQGFLTCPVCGKEFKPNDDTKYIATGGYTCSWKCFLNAVRKSNKEANEKYARNKRS